MRHSSACGIWRKVVDVLIVSGSGIKTYIIIMYILHLDYIHGDYHVRPWSEHWVRAQFIVHRTIYAARAGASTPPHTVLAIHSVHGKLTASAASLRQS